MGKNSETKQTSAPIEALRDFDTPTICNALELVCPERRLTGFTTSHLHCPVPQSRPTVGFARTATMQSATAPGGEGENGSPERTDYFRYVAEGSVPKVVVVQDLDGDQRGFGSLWGEVMSALHKAMGCDGLITDGAIRDVPDWAPEFAVLAGSVVPSHAWRERSRGVSRFASPE